MRGASDSAAVDGVDEGVEAEVGGERDVAGAEGGQVDRQFPATGSCGQVALFAHGTNPTHEGSEAASLRLPTQCSCRGEGAAFQMTGETEGPPATRPPREGLYRPRRYAAGRSIEEEPVDARPGTGARKFRSRSRRSC